MRGELVSSNQGASLLGWSRANRNWECFWDHRRCKNAKFFYISYLFLDTMLFVCEYVL